MGTRRLPLAAAALLLSAACATLHNGGGSGASFDVRRCRAAADPAHLPRAAELVDAERFQADAARLWAAAGRPEGHVVFSIRHDVEGAQVRRAVLESTLPLALSDTLQKLLFAYRRETAPARAEWGVRLRMDAGETPSLTVARGQACTPRPREWDYRTAGSMFDVRQGTGTGVANATPTDADVVWVHVRVDAAGQVTDARVENSARRGNWDQRVLNYVRVMEFTPATEDGEPVPGEMTIPVRLSQVR
jgi:TonB family protein